MSRILLAWELGRHLGHVSRLLPLAMRLKTRNHEVLAVVRDTFSASSVLGAAGVPFVQAPRHTGVADRRAQISSYADLLLSQGWNDPSALRGMLRMPKTGVRRRVIWIRAAACRRTKKRAMPLILQTRVTFT